MRRLGLALAALLFAPAVGQAQESPVAIKVGPEMNDVRVLPLSAKAAEAKYGALPPAQAKEVVRASEAFFTYIWHGRGAWSGPSLHSNRMECGGLAQNLCKMFFEPVDRAAAGKRLSGATVFDPYSLGSKDGRDFAVEMIKLRGEDGADPSWAALAFVLAGGKVEAMVLNPEPWITLIQTPPSPPAGAAPSGGGTGR